MYGYEEQIISKISVEGKSKMSFDPDVTIVRIEVKEIKKDYESLMKTASERIAAIKNAVEKAELDKSVLKASRINVNEEIKDIADKNGNHKYIPNGFRYYQVFTIKFAIDGEKLAGLLGAISESGLDSGVSVGYELKDPEAARFTLISKAAENAKAKATAIVDALGGKLVRILSVSHSDPSETDLKPRLNDPTRMLSFSGGLKKMLPPKRDPFEILGDPESITVDASVSVTWEIEG